MTVYHTRYLCIVFEVSDKVGLQDIESTTLVCIWLVLLYGFIFSLKELVITTTSLITGTTVHERQSELEQPYFKSKTGIKNPFDKGVLVHILESFYAFVGYDPSSGFDIMDLNGLIEDEEIQKQSEAETVMTRFINPYATRKAANWQHLDILSLFEFECSMRDVLVKAFRKRLRGDDSDDEEEDEDREAVDSIDFSMDHKNHESSQGGCCDDHGCGSKKKPQSRGVGNPASVVVSDPTMPSSQTRNTEDESI